MASALNLFRSCALTMLFRRTYATTDFSQTVLQHLKAKALRTDDDVLTMAKLKEIMTVRLQGTTWLDRQNGEQRRASTEPQRKSRSEAELVPRQMIESFSTAVIPLSKDTSMQERYVTFLGNVRLGRLMEDLDHFAVWVAVNHVAPLSESVLFPGNIVTLLVDSIDFTESFLKPRSDIRVSGFVSWCGRSTIETELWLEQEEDENDWKIVSNARFLMALRDPLTNKAAPVPPLVASDAFESRLLELAHERRKFKRAEEKSSLYNVGPHPSETTLLHSLIYENVIDEDSLPFQADVEAGSLLLERARLSSTVFSHPEDRNMYNTVFGGYLMRIAVELSWACTWVHMRQRPQLVRIGDIRFHRPVSVASLLRVRSFIIYTEGHDAIVKVTAFVHEPETGETFRTNDFHFTYHLLEPAPRVLPRSYESALMYLEGRRQLHGLPDTQHVVRH